MASRIKSPTFPLNLPIYFFPSCASATVTISTNSQGRDFYSPRLVASSSNVVSTAVLGICTYRTTEPRIKQFFTDICNAHTVSSGRGVMVRGKKTRHVREPFRV